MDVVITAKGAGLGAWVDDAFATAGHVVIVHDSGRFSALPNPCPEEISRVALAEFLVKTVQPGDILVTGTIGRKALDVLLSHGVKVYTAATGSVMELADSATRGELPLAVPQAEI